MGTESQDSRFLDSLLDEFLFSDNSNGFKMFSNFISSALKYCLIVNLFLGGTFAFATPGIKQREIILGSHQPLTGIAAEFADISKSTEIYFRYVNDQGGIHGRLLKYHYLDDGFQPIRTQEVVRYLVLEESVFLILNGLGTDTHGMVAPWLQALKIPDFFVGSSDPRWTEPLQKTTFGFHPPPQVEGRILGKYLLQTDQAKSVAIWYRDNSLMEQTTEYFSDLLVENNIQVHPIAHTTARLNPASDIEAIKQVSPDVVVLFTSLQPAIQFLKIAYEQQLSSKIFLGYDLADSRMLEWVGQEELDGVSFLISHPLATQIDHPGIQLHQALLREYAPEMEINRWTIYGQVIAELMVEILYRTGREVTREKIIQVAEQMGQWQSLLSPPIVLTPQNHQAITQLKIAEVKSGKFEVISDWIDFK